MIIDCHGHYTTTPKELGDYRDRQKADLKKNPQHQAVRRASSRSATTSCARASKARS